MESLYTAGNRIEVLKKRAERCVCKFCGGQLQLRRIIFNDIKEARVEIFCPQCDRIEFGVEPQIYKSAKNFVENLEFNYYETMNQSEKTHKMNIAKVCEIIGWSMKDMGYLDQNGFTVIPQEAGKDWAECLVASSDMIDEKKTFDEYLGEEL